MEEVLRQTSGAFFPQVEWLLLLWFYCYGGGPNPAGGLWVLNNYWGFCYCYHYNSRALSLAEDLRSFAVWRTLLRSPFGSGFLAQMEGGSYLLQFLRRWAIEVTQFLLLQFPSLFVPVCKPEVPCPLPTPPPPQKEPGLSTSSITHPRIPLPPHTLSLWHVPLPNPTSLTSPPQKGAFFLLFL